MGNNNLAEVMNAMPSHQESLLPEDPSMPALLDRRGDALVNTSVEITMNPPDVEDMTFGAKCLVAATLPYRDPKPEQLENGCWIRRNGDYTLWVQGGPQGLPYGAYPRVFTIWLTAEAIRTGSRRIETGGSFWDFCRKVQIDTSRGKRGSGRRFVEQAERLLSSRAAFVRGSVDAGRVRSDFLSFAEGFDLFFDVEKPDELGLFKSEITLTEAFFKEITEHSIPLDVRAVAALKSAPLELDVYQWLAYRNFTLRGQSLITWDQLQRQFGTGHARQRDFRRDFKNAVKNVQQVYPTARIEEDERGLILKASPTPIPKKLIIP